MKRKALLKILKENNWKVTSSHNNPPTLKIDTGEGFIWVTLKAIGETLEVEKVDVGRKSSSLKTGNFFHKIIEILGIDPRSMKIGIKTENVA